MDHGETKCKGVEKMQGALDGDRWMSSCEPLGSIKCGKFLAS